MSHVAFKQVDVFTQVSYRGNPVAVILDAQGLAGEQMQRIANWTLPKVIRICGPSLSENNS
jgi:PhzF family phenazine biosynthesis protein